MSKKKTEVFVIGHRNPDTDSICSSIAYAALKNKIAERNGTSVKYIARRAGTPNEETQFVLDYFKVKAPAYMKDVKPQVKDIEIRETKGVSGSMSLKRAWEQMKELDAVTLPITEGSTLTGIITVNDIATSYMDIYDSKVLSHAKPTYANIIDTLDGEMVVGDVDEIFHDGNVLIAAANPDIMEEYINKNDLVILGNRYESQLCAIEMEAGCIIVCDGIKVSKTIQKQAAEHGCTVISSPHDTFTVARLINQSMPISYLMKTGELLSFKEDDYIDTLKEVMGKLRNRDYPILDRNGNYLGMVSRRNLLNMRKKQLILVDHNERTQAVEGIDDADIIEIIDHHRLGSLETFSPLFFRAQPLGCTATIVYQMYREENIEIEPTIAGLLMSAILSDTMIFRSPTCTRIDRDAAEDLSKIAGVDIDSYGVDMFHAGSNLSSKSPEEIFKQDFKKFSVNDVNFGVGQINAMSDEELSDIRTELIKYLDTAMTETGVDMLFFMLTNILKENTQLLYIGNGAYDLIENAFSVTPRDGAFLLEGVVSRKKQLIPRLMSNLQQ